MCYLILFQSVIHQTNIYNYTVNILENCFRGPSETRTHDPLRAKQVLQPSELQARIRVFLTTLKDLSRINSNIAIRSFEILFSGQHLQIDFSISFQINLKPRNPTLQTTRHSPVLTFIVFNSGTRYYSQEVDIDI